MAEEKAANTAVKQGDHDRVAMLSLKPDGSPDQHDPEIIGDREFAKAATRRQFAEQAVAAADAAAREASSSDAETVGQDPTIEAAQKEHEKVSAAAEKAADKVVDALHEG